MWATKHVSCDWPTEVRLFPGEPTNHRFHNSCNKGHLAYGEHTQVSRDSFCKGHPAYGEYTQVSRDSIDAIYNAHTRNTDLMNLYHNSRFDPLFTFPDTHKYKHKQITSGRRDGLEVSVPKAISNMHQN